MSSIKWITTSNKCFECGAPADHNHHVIPKSKGGTKTIPLCTECHAKVHGHDGWKTSTKALTKAALAAKKARGERVGEIPFGFGVDSNGKLFANPKEQKVIASVVQFRNQKMSLRAIMTELNKMGFKSRKDKCLGLTQVARIVKMYTI